MAKGSIILILNQLSMNNLFKISGIFLISVLLMTSCVTKKKHASIVDDLSQCRSDLARSEADFAKYLRMYEECQKEIKSVQTTMESTTRSKDATIQDLKTQVDDLIRLRDRQMEVVQNLTVLSQSANANINETLQQLEKKDKYIRTLQAAKTKADSINLALAVNLKGVLPRGLDDDDIEIKVDKTVVLINLSDKMLFSSGSATLSARANEVLGKIAAIISSREEFEVLVEGYTDNVPIRTDCIADNWDLSVRRSTAVVRKLQNDFGVDPNRLIAVGRGEYNTLAANTTSDGRSKNRRTRIIIMPKLDQFYDLLDPSKTAALID
jgi:chemotaxis protein MotB